MKAQTISTPTMKAWTTLTRLLVASNFQTDHAHHFNYKPGPESLTLSSLKSRLRLFNFHNRTQRNVKILYRLIINFLIHNLRGNQRALSVSLLPISVLNSGSETRSVLVPA
ncbi:hypothetical protein LguiB_005794 [Lonicera macranthoides]